MEKKQSKKIISTQGYIIISPDKKFLFMKTFLKKNTQSKILFIFSTSQEVEFYKTLLIQYHIDSLTISQSQTEIINKENYKKFTQNKKGILLSTNLIKLKFTLPIINWIIFFDTPKDINEYNEMITINSKEDFSKTKSLLLLFPSEEDFIKNNKSINKFNYSEGKIDKDQKKVEKIVNTKDHYLYSISIDAYRAFLFDYVTRSDKVLFDLDKVDVRDLCKSFGIEHPPFVNFNKVLGVDTSIKDKKSKKKIKKRKNENDE